MIKDIIIDVGANYGLFSLEIAKRNPDKFIIAFEPEPNLAEILENKAIEFGITNHKVERLAISTEVGEAQLHVSKIGDWGTSSLREFNQEHLKKNEYWSQRSDLKHSETVNVKTITLEKYLDSIRYKKISFIKIDAQGLDLEVLQSMGRHLENLSGGMFEVSSLRESAPYIGEEVDLRIALNKVYDLNFVVYNIKPNDPASNEFNLFFRHKSITVESLETHNDLRNLNIYDGKNYWHYPSHKLENVELMLSNLSNKIINQQSALDDLQTRYDEVTNQFFVKWLLATRKLLMRIIYGNK